MPQRRVIVSPLDLGRRTFSDFLDNHFADLKQELLQECERIASARELLLRKQLHDSHVKIEELSRELDKTAKETEGNVLQVVENQGNQSIINSSDSKDIVNIVTAKIDEDKGRTTVDIDVPKQKSLEEEPALSTSHVEKFHDFRLWGEWQALVDSHSRFGSSIDSQMQEENIVFENTVEVLGERRAPVVRQPVNSCNTVSPNSAYVISWEVLGIPVLFYDLVMIPMQVFHTFDGLPFKLIGWVLTLYWTVDLFLRLLVIGGLDSDGRIHLERKDFMKMYLHRSFLFDLCMVLPDWIQVVFGAGGLRNVALLRLVRILRLMRLMRMSKMKKLFRSLEDAIDSEYFTVGVSLVVNLFAILGMCHYLGCFWFLLGSLDIDGQPSWVEQHVQNFEWQHQYVISLHWAIAQFTPGASNIQPANIVESAGSIAVLIFGLIFLSLFISALSQARARLQALTSKIDRDNWTLRRYLRQQGVSLDLQVRTLRYVEKCVEPQFSRIQRKDVFLLPLLSRPLQLEVQKEQYYHTLIAHAFFSSLRDRSLALTLNLFMRVIMEVLLADADLLFEVGGVSHEMIFVSKGSLAYLHHGGRKMDYVDVGGWCCEAVLWVEWVHKGTAKAEKDCSVISIDSSKLRSSVLEHKERKYVSLCAVGYAKDLNQLEHHLVDDLTRFTDDASSAYMQAITGEPVHARQEDIRPADLVPYKQEL